MQNSGAGDSPATGSQYYVNTVGLGNDYPYSSYALMTAVSRDFSTKYTWYRTREGGGWGSWVKGASGYADSAGNEDTVDGYHVSVGGSANTIPTRNGSGYLAPNNWIEFNGYYGIYSPNNSAHFYPNPNSYGAWRCDGSRNGWQGIEFQGQTTLMMNDDAYGFHRNTGGGWRFYNTGGNGYFPGSVQAYWSDRRLKENLIPIKNEALDILGKFTTYRFNWNSKVKELELPIEVGKEEIGLIAQEVQAVLPDAVAINKSLNKVNEDGTQADYDYLTINYDRITPLLVEGVNLLKQEIEALKAEIAELKGQK
jgi:hypothetical protein